MRWRRERGETDLIRRALGAEVRESEGVGLEIDVVAARSSLAADLCHSWSAAEAS
jgi:hypothetical protein